MSTILYQTLLVPQKRRQRETDISSFPPCTAAVCSENFFYAILWKTETSCARAQGFSLSRNSALQNTERMGMIKGNPA
jgi:hypothetical protein